MLRATATFYRRYLDIFLEFYPFFPPDIPFPAEPQICPQLSLSLMFIHISPLNPPYYPSSVSTNSPIKFWPPEKVTGQTSTDTSLIRANLFSHCVERALTPILFWAKSFQHFTQVHRTFYNSVPMKQANDVPNNWNWFGFRKRQKKWKPFRSISW